ncbi:hypothetical protein JOM56_005686 [Amanita muscaria]
MTLLLPLVNKWQELKGKTGKNSPGTKSFFRTFFHNEWIDAILQLEELQPLLTYCAGHWKAEAVLQNMLDSLCTKEGNDRVDDIDDADDMYNADVEQGGQNQSKRPYMPSMDSTHRSPKRNKTTAAVDLTSSKPNSRRVKTFMPTLASKGKPTHAAARMSRQGSLLTTTAKNMGMTQAWAPPTWVLMSMVMKRLAVLTTWVAALTKWVAALMKWFTTLTKWVAMLMK